MHVNMLAGVSVAPKLTCAQYCFIKSTLASSRCQNRSQMNCTPAHLMFRVGHAAKITLVDPRARGTRDAGHPFGSISVIFTRFLTKILLINGFLPQTQGLALPSLRNSESTTGYRDFCEQEISEIVPEVVP